MGPVASAATGLVHGACGSRGSVGLLAGFQLGFWGFGRFLEILRFVHFVWVFVLLWRFSDSVVLWRKQGWIFLTLSLATKDHLFGRVSLAPVADLLSSQVPIWCEANLSGRLVILVV